MRELLARLRRAGCADGDNPVAQVHCAVCKAGSERARAAAAQEVARSEEALLALVTAMSGGADTARNDATTALLTIAKAGPECKSAITRHPRVLSALASAVSGEVRSSRCALAVIGFVIGPAGSSSTHATARRVGKAEGMFDALAGALAAADCGVSGLAASAIALLCNALPAWLQRVRRNDGGAIDAALAALRSGVGPSAELVALATQGSPGCAARVAADGDALRVLCVMAAGGPVSVIAGCPASAAGVLASLIRYGHAGSVQAACQALADVNGDTAQQDGPGESACLEAQAHSPGFVSAATAPNMPADATAAATSSSAPEARQQDQGEQQDARPPKACAACGKTKADGAVLRRCRGCGDVTGVRYCSDACQRGAWKEHRQACKAAQLGGDGASS